MEGKKLKSLSELLSYSTMHITSTNNEGLKSEGTGFIFQHKGNTHDLIYVITNKHVVENNTNFMFKFIISDEQGNPDDQSYETIELTNFDKYWKFHPNPEVDLCALLLDPIVIEVNKKNIRPYFIPFSVDLIPSNIQLEELKAIEDVLMIGYPIGLYDNVNNKPIVRKGITATHPILNYRGRNEFLIDIAVFPGSSGSPVVILNENGYHDKYGINHAGKPRLILLGVLYAGHIQKNTGEIENMTVPSSIKQVPVINNFVNLGIVIKSEQIRVLLNQFAN